MKTAKNSLIVVSNRLPVSLFHRRDHWEIKPSTGGLASALNGVKKEMDFEWIGWPGSSFLDSQKPEIISELKDLNLYPVFMSAEQEQQYYHLFCNSILWPLFHYFTDHITHNFDSWKYYEQVNRLFADSIIERAPCEATVWVHDFHLMLIPSILKEARPDLKIGFFLHIPFPSSEIYRMFPKREELLKGVLGADYIGFHTSDYARHFKLACSRVLGSDTLDGSVYFNERKVGVGVHPIGMDIHSFKKVFEDQTYLSYIQEIQSRYEGHQVVLGVERLDYTKGISLKLSAFERFLDNHPEKIGQVILLQIIVPSRHQSVEYQNYRIEIEKTISRINGKYSKPGFIPIQYIYRNLPLNELIALFCLADVCMVASIRDGMNLVAQEFVYCASHMPEGGVLLLSEFAGASHHLPQATLINPLDIEDMAKHIDKALKMPMSQRTSKIQQMVKYVQNLDSPRWAKNFLDKLNNFDSPLKSMHSAHRIDEKSRHQLLISAKEASKRIFFLDYDGTIADIAPTPMKAAPNSRVLKSLENLSSLANTEVHIVSGRDAKTLESWFAKYPIHLAAEHGFQLKEKDQSSWKCLKECDISWKDYVKKLLLPIVEEVPGSFIEEKQCSICWHYRLSDLEYGKWRAQELHTSLMHDLTNLPVEILLGKKVIEVRSCGISKANYVQRVLNQQPDYEFVLCMGDDRTDEEMFKALKQKATSIHVGNTSSNATYQVESPAEALDLLDEIYQIAQVGRAASLDE